MRALYTHSVRFLQSEDGPTAAEYAVLIALICVGVIAVMSSFGDKLTNIYMAVAGTMPNASAS